MKKDTKIVYETITTFKITRNIFEAFVKCEVPANFSFKTTAKTEALAFEKLREFFGDTRETLEAKANKYGGFEYRFDKSIEL